MYKLYLIFLAVFFINCKEDKETKKVVNQVIRKEEIIASKTNKNCLSLEDSILIKQFKKNILKSIKSYNKEQVSTYIEFPYKSGVHSVSKEDFITGDSQIVTSYFNISLIDKEELEHLKSIETYVPKEDDSECFQYLIERSFPDLEFTARFYLDKLENEIKIVRIDFAG